MSGVLFDYVVEGVSQLRQDLIQDMNEEELEQERLIDRLTEIVLSQIEGFASALPEVCWDILKSDGIVEDAFLRDMLRRIPGMAKRVGQIMPIASKEPRSGATEVFLTEATRCYIFGFWHASVALSRAALEEGLWTAMKDKLPSKPEKLRDLLKHSVWSGTLDSASADLADQVVRTGNRVLHGNPASREKAWDVLCAVRGVLFHLFGHT